MATKTANSGPRPWLNRPVDLLYFSFLLFGLFAAFTSDLLPLYPPSLVPKFMLNMSESYIQSSNDPLTAGGIGKNGPPMTWQWFTAMVVVEGFLQVPLMIASVWYLRKDSPKAYLFVLGYGISVFTSTYPCISVINSYPISSKQLINVDGSIASLTSAEKSFILTLYSPFLIIPMLMTVDMGYRVVGLIDKAVAVEKVAKRE